MPVFERIQGLFLLLIVFGLFFWASVLFTPASRERMRDGWNWLQWRTFPRDLPGWIGGGFCLGILLQSAYLYLEKSVGGILLQPGVRVLMSILLFQGLLSLVLYVRIHRMRLEVPKVLGLDHPFQLGDLVGGLVGYCMSLPLVALSGLLTTALFDSVGKEIAPQPILDSLSELDGWLNCVTLFLLVVFIGPLLEEVIFRGFLFSWLRQRMGAPLGLVVQAVIFAVIHQYAAGVLPLFALSLVLGLAYVYTQRLMVCVWMHMFFNGMSLVNLMFLTGAVG